MKNAIYLAIATFLLGAASSWFLAKYYYEVPETLLPPIINSESDKVVKSITDTSGIHARNELANKSEDTIKTNNFATKKQLHEIKNNLRYSWNIALNDSLVNAWRQFEAQHRQLLPEIGVGDR